MNESNRWAYYADDPAGDPCGVPELIAIGIDRLQHAMSLGEHDHDGHEFALIAKGKVSWEINGIAYDTRAGDMFHTYPGEVHQATRSVIEPCQLCWLVITAPDSRSDWFRLASAEIGAVERKLEALPRIVHTGIFVRDLFQRIQSAITGADPLRSLVIRQSILELLITVFRPANGSAIADDISGQLQLLIGQMKENPEWRPSIEQLAFQIKVSTSHFYRMFQEYTGLTPMSFMERMRIEMACKRLLESDISITTLAYELGYQSSQHFSTVFKRYTGSTPTAWRAGKQ